jgi:hypothetical protein
MHKTIIEKNNYSFHFLNYNNLINYENFITWYATNNPIYNNLPKYLLSSEYTGVIFIFIDNKKHIEIKIYEGYYIKIINYTDNLICYIENNKIPLEIRENNNINKINVKYIYDNFIITNKENNIFDIFYNDTLGVNDFNIKNTEKTKLTEEQLVIFNKFYKLIKEIKGKINCYTELL